MKSPEFLRAVSAMQQAETDRLSGKLKSVPAGRAREAALCEAVMQLAIDQGAVIEKIPCFTSRAELRIVGMYSAEFAAIVNGFRPRCGIYPTAVMSEGQQWCYMNHFDAERMVLSQLP